MESQKATILSPPLSKMVDEHVLICVAWPYANGPLHLGHVAGCYLPPDITFRYERAKGNRVLLVSGSDEHGTPITVTAEQQGVSPQDIIDKFHAINKRALIELGCFWEPNIDTRGPEYGGALFNRTSDPRHRDYVQDNFVKLHDAGLFEQKTMQQYYEVREEGGRFLPDRYVEGDCPLCDAEGARGDQCDECGQTYESHELKNPRSKMNPEASIEIRDTEHFFYRLDLFQDLLVEHASKRQKAWKSNVRAMTKQWLDMGLRPRAVTRDLEWGVKLPLEGNEWQGKCVYVWFEAVQGYYSCARIWAERYAAQAGHPLADSAWESWWKNSENGPQPRHLYFLGKDNIPFHTVIWPALIMGINHANNGLRVDDKPQMPGAGDLHLEDNVPAMEYLMLSGGQFSKSRKHAVWLPAFLQRFSADTLRYYLSINMPENHDTDFNWPDFVERVNSELIATYGNFTHRVLTLAARLETVDDKPPLSRFDEIGRLSSTIQRIEEIHVGVCSSLEQHRYKEALRSIMSIAQIGNQLLQASTPWKYLKDTGNDPESLQSLASLSFSWRISRYLAIATQPFLPFSAQQLWANLGLEGNVEDESWNSATDWAAEMTMPDNDPQPLFKKLDLQEILDQEQALAGHQDEEIEDVAHIVKGGKKNTGSEKMSAAPEGITYLDFETFMSVELRVGKIIDVNDHPNADKLYIVNVDDGSQDGRIVCAGLKEYYSPEQMQGMAVVFVANLKPRKLRGVMSEGMLLAADDGQGNVKLVTIDGEISCGSQVR